MTTEINLGYSTVTPVTIEFPREVSDLKAGDEVGVITKTKHMFAIGEYVAGLSSRRGGLGQRESPYRREV